MPILKPRQIPESEDEDGSSDEEIPHVFFDGIDRLESSDEEEDNVGSIDREDDNFQCNDQEDDTGGEVRKLFIYLLYCKLSVGPV